MPKPPRTMPPQAAYDAYRAGRASYNFTSLDYTTWASWELGIERYKLKGLTPDAEVPTDA